MSDSYVHKPVGDNHMRSSTGNAVQNLLVALSVAGLWLIVTAAEPQDGYSSSNYRYPDEYWTNYRKYAVSVGAVGLFFGLLALGLARFKPSVADKKLMTVRAHDVSLLQAFAVFFVLWWGVGTGVGTFKAPFFPGPTETFTSRPVGNGYFSLWTGFIASLLLLGETMSMREGASSFLNHTGGLFFAAVMLLIATIKYVDPNDGVGFPSAGLQTQTTDHIAVFGMASASATILITLLMMFADVKEAAVQTLVPILVLLWAATAGVLTFREGSPFTTLNNGYLASWLGFFVATRMMGLNAGSRIFQILALGVIVLLAGYFPVGSNSVGGGTEMVYENNIVPDDQAYMIAVGALAGFLALFHYWCSVFKPALLETVLFNVADSPVTVRRAIALFLVPWAAAGAIVGTFAVSGGGLFLAPVTFPLIGVVGVVGNANGFFAIWLLLIVCIGHLGDEMEEAKAAYADALSSTMFLFLFASTILIGSLLFGDVIQNGDNGSNPDRADFAEYIYGLVIACVSAAFALYHLVLKAPLPLITKIGTPLLALAWVAAAGVLTFRTASVFTVACNGFFSVYFGLFLSVSLFAKVHLFSSRVEPPVDDVLSAA